MTRSLILFIESRFSSKPNRSFNNASVRSSIAISTGSKYASLDAPVFSPSSLNISPLRVLNKLSFIVFPSITECNPPFFELLLGFSMKLLLLSI
ncbi:unnamed protein product [Trifolium pratense]|uniref:Uncharacterized protein n=1 Tax=Trifolium pratense TaxID=57577 RepID=A0ACB0LK83_TRIPR|nr:unnamed protein product [Trifolium pratense]